MLAGVPSEANNYESYYAVVGNDPYFVLWPINDGNTWIKCNKSSLTMIPAEHAKDLACQHDPISVGCNTNSAPTSQTSPVWATCADGATSRTKPSTPADNGTTVNTDNYEDKDGAQNGYYKLQPGATRKAIILKGPS